MGATGSEKVELFQCLNSTVDQYSASVLTLNVAEMSSSLEVRTWG